MIITPMDCFYIVMIGVIFAFIIHLEVKVSSLVSMMEEHVRIDDRLCDISKKLDETH
jgi:hypothetical protein